LFVSGLALVLCFVWIFEESFVLDMGRKITGTYSATYRNKLKVAKTALSNSPDRGISQLEALLADLALVEKGDRLAPIKVQALESLVSVQEKNGVIERALAAAEQWSSFDNRDLFGHFALARLLFKTPGRQNEGAQILNRLKKLAPAHPEFVNLYNELEIIAEILLKEDKLVEAFLVLRHSLLTPEALRGRMWQIFWDMGTGFSNGQRESFFPTFEVNGEFEIPFAVPGAARALRLDPPPNVRMVIEEPVLLRSKNAGQYGTDLLDLSLRFNQMSQVGNILITIGGNDPFFSWDVPASLDEVYSDYIFSAYVHEELPSLVYDLLRHPEADSLKALLEAAGEKEAAEQLAEISRKISRQAEFQKQVVKAQKLINVQQGSMVVFWRQGEERFNEHRKIGLPFRGVLAHDQLLFDFSMHIDSSVSQLRIDFPEGAGVEYSIESVEIYADGHRHTINLGRTDTTTSPGLKKDGNRFLTIGPDPYFYFAFQGEQGPVETVRIQGRAQ
jgi:hypothetical protein